VPAPDRDGIDGVDGTTGFERLRGVRVVGDPGAIDTARWHGDGDAVTVLRFAPDDAFGIGAQGVDVGDDHAIVEAESGFVGAWLPLDRVTPHIEWTLPTDRPALAQGAVAAVPAKVWLPEHRPGEANDKVLLLTAAAYAHDLEERLG
jgi:hypothetical protein